MEDLKKMQDCLIELAEEQIYSNLANVDAKELGEVIDMIKDISETIYYHTVTEAMESKDWEYKHDSTMYYNPSSTEMHDLRHEGRHYPTMTRATKGEREYGGLTSGGGDVSHGGHIYRDDMWYGNPMRDPKEGRSGERRKMYMDGKGRQDKSKQMQELDQYMQELANDMSEMIQDASPEEKQLLQQKIAVLASKIK